MEVKTIGIATAKIVKRNGKTFYFIPKNRFLNNDGTALYPIKKKIITVDFS